MVQVFAMLLQAEKAMRVLENRVEQGTIASTLDLFLRVKVDVLGF